MRDCFIKIRAEAGMGGFFKGFTPCLMRSVPANAATFLCYEVHLKPEKIFLNFFIVFAKCMKQ